MKKLFTISSAAAALSLAATGFAASAPMPAPAPMAAAPASYGTAPGWYVGLGAGLGGMDTPKLNSDEKSPADVQSHSEDIMGFAARLYGGYMWDIASVEGLQLGLELGYTYYQDNKYKLGGLYDNSGVLMPNSYIHWDYKGYNVDLLGVAKYNFAQTGWNVIGKAGAAYVSQKFDLNFNNVPTDHPGIVVSGHGDKSKNKVLPKVAAGVGYDFNKYVGVSLTGDYIFGTKPKNLSKADDISDMTKVADVYTVMLNVTYHFDM
jgi:outer membrane immunogenic protein